MPEMNNLKVGNDVYEIADSKLRLVQPIVTNVLGAKNLLPISLQSQTVDGEITVTVNTADKSITLNGTASTVKVINFQSTFMLPAGNWDILQFDGSTNYYVQVAYNNAPVWWNGVSENAHLFELIEPKEMSAQLVFAPGTYINETIKVMIIPQGTDPAYTPYAMTNRELTVKTVTETITANANSWLSFPVGRTVLNAYIANTYNKIILTQEFANSKYIGRWFVDINGFTFTPALLTANTDYSITYQYIG